MPITRGFPNQVLWKVWEKKSFYNKRKRKMGRRRFKRKRDHRPGVIRKQPNANLPSVTYKAFDYSHVSEHNTYSIADANLKMLDWWNLAAIRNIRQDTDGRPWGTGLWLGSARMYSYYRIVKIDWELHCFNEGTVGNQDKMIAMAIDHQHSTATSLDTAAAIENPHVFTRHLRPQTGGNAGKIKMSGSCNVLRFRTHDGGAAWANEATLWSASPSTAIPFLTLYVSTPPGSAATAIGIRATIKIRFLVELIQFNFNQDPAPA